LTGVLVGQLSGQPLTVQGIANEIDMPRTNVLRKLHDLMQRGHVYRVDNRYYAAEHVIQASSCLDDVIDVLLDAAARLRQIGRPDRTK
jgi:DNA-binding IclR family transcriptional regulator